MTSILSLSECLEFAGNMLERQDNRELCVPGLIELNSIGQHGMPTASGLNDYDYQNLSILSMGQKQLVQIRTRNKIPLPSEILEHFKHIKCHCMMGLFPEIGRAWLSIDSEIYIWAYEHNHDISYYDGLNHLIVSVGIAKPKSGVFISNVKYLLILTTPVEIIVLGITFSDTSKTISSRVEKSQEKLNHGEMQLMNKPIFILSTDNVAINIVKSSNDGRIFLGGRDGCIYELFYQAESSWFGRRCKKINISQGFVSLLVPNFFKESDSVISIDIDNSRNLLYMLSEKGIIEAWDLGQNYNSVKRIARVTQNDLIKNASNVIKTVDPTIFNSIKSITALTTDDCPTLNLFAVSQCGVRLYFTTKNFNISQEIATARTSTGTQNLSFQEDVQSIGLHLLHVRLPPGYTPNTTTSKPKQVHSAYYKEGTLLLISTSQQNQDILWSISSAPFSNRPYLTESTTVLPLDGLVWGLEQVSNQSQSKFNSVLRKSQKPSKIVVLTNQGAHIMELLKPCDILYQLLLACNGPQHDAVKGFFQTQQAHEACATCLLIACSKFYRGTEVAIWAAQAFMLYGGEPSYQNQSKMPLKCSTLTGSELNLPIFMSTPTSNLSETTNYHLFQSEPNQICSPIANNTNLYASGVVPVFEGNNIVYSAKHDGLYIHISRLLRPVWKSRIVDKNFCSILSQDDCIVMLEDLYAIKYFLDVNAGSDISNTPSFCERQKNIIDGFDKLLQNNDVTLSQQGAVREQAQSDEKRSITALNSLIQHTCEVVELWKILCEHQIQILVNKLTKEQQSLLLSCSFRDLILTHYELCATLIVILINSYIKDNAGITAISTKLRDICPNLYRHEDAVAFKATEILIAAKNCGILEEKNEKLRIAMQLCKDAAPNIPLQSICQQFTLSNFYEAVIELTVACATKIDPEEYGLHFYNSEEPVEDQDGFSAYTARMSCYKEVRVMLDHIYQTLDTSNEHCSFSHNVFEKGEPKPISKIMEIATFGMQFKDPVLHSLIYEWLMTHNMDSTLLSLSEPTLGEFLRRSVIRNPKNLKYIDLLWKYYERNGYHTEAAQILDDLGTSKNDLISLEQRTEFLSRAVMCMRNNNIGYSVSNGVLIKEIEDKLEIARVQSFVLDSLKSLSNKNTDILEAIKRLNFMLYDITQLYEIFADPFDLLECKLVILNCSHHNDPLLIESIWSKLLAKYIESPSSTIEQSSQLFAKVESLYKQFGESGHCFPLSFLIRELEIKACQLKFPEGLVAEKLITMNIDIDLLLDYYLRMISMNERVWTNEGNEWHLVYSSLRIVTLLTTQSKDVLKRSKRRRVLGKAQDIISACLNLCYQKPNTENLQQSLKEAQFRLQRCLL